MELATFFGVSTGVWETRLRSFVVLCAVVLAVCAITIAVIVRQHNHTIRERAEALMNGADKLYVSQSSLDSVLAYSRQFGGEERSRYPKGNCTRADCLVVVSALPLDFMSHYPRLIATGERVGVHTIVANVSLWVKDGKLEAVEKVFISPKGVGGLLVVITTSRPSDNLRKSPSYLLHPGYATSFTYSYGSPIFRYWTDAETQPQPRMNLQCVTSFAGCTAVSQILPTAWAQYQADQRMQ